MLPKSKRLNLRKDFKWVASGQKLETKYLKLFIRFGENTFPRIGIAIQSQVFKKATQRNRAKRLVSRAFQSTNYLMPSTINIVVLPKAGMLDVKSSDVLLDLEQGLKEARLI